MKSVFKVVGSIVIAALTVFAMAGCDANPEVVYPLKLTITGLPASPLRGQEILSAGIFDSPENIMPPELLSGEMPLEDMMKKATAGGISKIKDQKAVIELMDPTKLINFTTTGEYYVALMVGKSMDDLQIAYIFVADDEDLKDDMEASEEATKEELEELLASDVSPLTLLPSYNFSGDVTIDLSKFAEVTAMFDTLFGEE